MVRQLKKKKIQPVFHLFIHCLLNVHHVKTLPRVRAAHGHDLRASVFRTIFPASHRGSRRNTPTGKISAFQEHPVYAGVRVGRQTTVTPFASS